MQHLGFTRFGNPRGYPLAIIHGWGCSSSFLRPLAEMFPERDIYLIDLPGYGKSSHLAPLASDFTATTYLLVNTIPYAADVISWSFGTLYALHAISAIANPCLRPENYTQLLQHNPNLSDLTPTTRATPTSESTSATGDFQRLTSHPTGGKFSENTIVTTRRSNDCSGNSGCCSCSDSELKPQHSLLDCTLTSSSKRPYVRSLITICGTPRFPADPNWKGMDANKILKCNTVLTPHRVRMILRLFYRMMSANATAKEAAYIKEVASKQAHLPFEVLQAGIQVISYVDERPALQNLKIPSLHLFGAHDTLVPCSLAALLNQSPLHSTYVFPYSAHNPYLSEPESFKRVVDNFFDKVSPMDFTSFARLRQESAPKTELSLAAAASASTAATASSAAPTESESEEEGFMERDASA